MDNADELPIVRPFLLPKPLGHILLTTRWQFPNEFATPLAVEAMEAEEGLRFLYKRSGIEQNETEDAIGCQIVEEMGGHALALDQAGAYIQETGVSFANYLKLYKENHRTLLDQYGALDDEHITVAATFKTSLERASNMHPVAEDIMYFCAYLQPDTILEEIFQYDESFKANAMAFNKGIAALQRYSLIKPNRQDRTYSIHRLMQAVLIDTMPLDLRKQRHSRVSRTLLDVFQNEAFQKSYYDDGKATGWKLLMHVLNCASKFQGDIDDLPDSMQLVYKLGSYLLDHLWFSEAEHILTTTVGYYSHYFGPKHLHTASAMHDLAVLYMRQGRYEQAKPLLERGLSIQEKRLGTEHPDTAKSIDLLAHLYHRQHKYEQAESLYRQALSIWALHPHAVYVDMAPTYHGLAMLMQDQGAYEQAETLFHSALGIREQQLGTTHPHTQETKRAYANLLRRIGRDTEAAAMEVDDEPLE